MTKSRRIRPDKKKECRVFIVARHLCVRKKAYGSTRFSFSFASENKPAVIGRRTGEGGGGDVGDGGTGGRGDEGGGSEVANWSYRHHFNEKYK